MKRHIKHLALLMVLVGAIGCSTQPKPAENPVALFTEPSIYHWKTTFETDSTSLNFLRQHDIKRIYLRMFDIAFERQEVNPIATTRFSSPIPEGIEVVPVVYITIDALREMKGKEAEYAELIVNRVEAMCNYNKLGTIGELQFDCDWTTTTKHSYTLLCGEAKRILEERGVDLSITVRLHQLAETPPPADRGVLMLYNMGAIKNRQTRNSILDIEDAKPYLQKNHRYPIPLAYAYPTFGWGVRFYGDSFDAIVSEQDKVYGSGYIRWERATADEILEVKALVEQRLGKPSYGNIIYHLDNSQLNHYTHDEISQMLCY